MTCIVVRNKNVDSWNNHKKQNKKVKGKRK